MCNVCVVCEVKIQCLSQFDCHSFIFTTANYEPKYLVFILRMEESAPDGNIGANSEKCCKYSRETRNLLSHGVVSDHEPFNPLEVSFLHLSC